MALFKDQEQKKLLGQERPIDGNRIVSENRQRRNQGGQYGMIRNTTTGETIETRSDREPEQEMNYNDPEIEQIGRDTSHDEDMMDADEGYRNYSQSHEYETGMVPSYEQYQEFMQSEEAPEQMNPQELEDSKVDYLNTMGGLSNFMEDKGISLNDLIDRLPEDLDQEMDVQGMIEKIKDPRKIESMDDVIAVGMAIDYFADFLNLDAEKFFTTGEAVERSEDDPRSNNAIHQRDNVPSYEDRLANLEQQ